MKKSTAIRSLLLSGLSMLLCFSMLIGSTFAWFTDEVTSGTNTIVAGNLDVELYNGLDDSAEKVGPSTMLFDKIALWEPGAVMFENFTVANEGNLALKYNFSVNITEATANNLADVLKVGVVEGGVAEKATRAEALAAVTSWMPFASFVEAGTLDAGESDVYGIVIWWEPTDNDNAYKEASVNIGVNLFATQLEAESDSFGPDYDAQAPFSVWDGTVPAEMPDSIVLTLAPKNNQGGTITIKDATGFAYLNKLVDDFKAKATEINGYDHYYYHWEWDIELEADIDLDNHPFNTVALNYFGSFDGNGHTITNIDMVDGQTSLFVSGTISNLFVKNIDVNAPGVNKVGAIVSGSGTLNNVHVENASVTGGKYVGGLAGKCASLINCSIKDSTIVASDKTVGGLAGYSIGDPNPTVVKYNVVENVTVTGAYNVGGLLGQAQNEEVFENTLKNVIVINTTDVLPSDADETEVLSAEVAARIHGAATVRDNAVENVVAGTGANTDASDNAGFEAALKDTTSECIIVNVDADVTYDVAAWATDAMGGNVTKVIVINGNGHTITFNQTNSDWNNIVTNGAKLIINDAKITNSGKNDGPWNRHDLNFACDVELNNVTSDKALAFKAGATLKNVTINDANTSDTYAIWIQPKGQTIDIDGLVIDMLDCTDGRGIKIDNQYLGADEEAAVTLNIKNATFKTEEKSAILVKSTKGATINAENIDITGVAADATNAVWVDEASSAYANLVKVNGASVIVEP